MWKFNRKRNETKISNIIGLVNKLLWNVVGELNISSCIFDIIVLRVISFC